MATSTASTSVAPTAQTQAQIQNPSQDSSPDSLKAAIFQRLHPRVYLERFLAEDVRPDGRALGTVGKEENEIWRDISINVGMSSSLTFVLPQR